jgi:hypothetical protein
MTVMKTKINEIYGAVVCLGMLLTGSHAFAQYNAALLSVSITNGTSVTPRAMFTQTWTFTNNGTVTWTNGINGCTLDLTSLDSLGAIPLLANTDDDTHHFPRATINSGKNVVPGQTATYSMNFIAPEAAGSYTDSFQLNGTTWFGPVVTVQVVVGNTGNTNEYDRCRAVSFANNYAAYYCPDGYFWTNGSDFSIVTPNTFTPVPTGAGVADGIGDDCAHFVSYCIGRGPYVRGGGLVVTNRGGTYGEPGSPEMINVVLLQTGYGVQVSSLSQLEPGDVVGWNWEGETNIESIDHVTLYMGNGMFTCHAASLLDVDTADFGTGPVTVPGTGFAWHLIHILDTPTLWTSKSGNNMAFMWTTCWTNYFLYSASSMNGPWTKISTKPSVIGGITNKLTLTMPTSGAAFYSLQMH